MKKRCFHAEKKLNLHEEKYLEILETVKEAKVRLIRDSENVIIKQGVINLYPEGPDKKQAIKDCEEAKRHLICTIGDYDARCQEAVYYAEIYNEELGGIYTSEFLSSHQWIEFTYKKMVLK